MFSPFCKHEYVLYKKGYESINHGGCFVNKLLYYFICKKCEKTNTISADWIKREISLIKDKHKKMKALGKPLPQISSIEIQEGFRTGIIKGAYVTEFITTLENKGYDCSIFNQKF